MKILTYLAVFFLQHMANHARIVYLSKNRINHHGDIFLLCVIFAFFSGQIGRHIFETIADSEIVTWILNGITFFAHFLESKYLDIWYLVFFCQEWLESIG